MTDKLKARVYDLEHWVLALEQQLADVKEELARVRESNRNLRQIIKNINNNGSAGPELQHSATEVRDDAAAAASEAPVGASTAQGA